jgi:GR25 family glycosyltransferase involved in LPS biosynthesis
MSRPLDQLVDKIIIINLDHQPDRYQHTVKLVKNISDQIPQRVSAIDGNRLTETEIDHVCNPNYPVHDSKGAIGCSLTHQLVWKQISQSTQSHVLVLEDDVTLLPGYHKSLTNITEILPTYQSYTDWFDILYLGSFGFSTPKQYKSRYHRFLLRMAKYQWGRHSIPSPSSKVRFPFYLPDYPVGLYSYIITPSGAERLLNLVKRDGIMTHLDLQLNYYRPHLNLLAIYPKVMSQNYQLSTISSPTPRLLNRALGGIVLEDGVPLVWSASHTVHGISGWTWVFAILILWGGWPMMVVWLVVYGYDAYVDGKFPLNHRSMSILVCCLALNLILGGKIQ